MNTKQKNFGRFALPQLLLTIAVIALLAIVAIPKALADAGSGDVGITNFFKAQTGYFGAQYATNVIPCDNVSTFDLILTGSGSAAGTDAITISLAPCVDSSRTLLATNTAYSFTFPLAGQTTFRVRTNFSASVVGGAGGFAVIQITNAAASCNLTNVSLYWVKKRSVD